MYIKIHTFDDGISWYYHTDRKTLTAFFTFSDGTHFKCAHSIKPVDGLRIIDSIYMKIGESSVYGSDTVKNARIRAALVERW